MKDFWLRRKLSEWNRDAGWNSLAYGLDEQQCQLPADQEELFRQTKLPLDTYLAIPTFIRRGRIIFEPGSA